MFFRRFFALPFPVVLSASMLGLMAATWRLWWGLPEFPQVPWFDFLRQMPTELDRVASCLAVAAWGVALLTSRCRPWQVLAVMIALTAMGGLFALNQHRMQPWAYHGWLAGWICVALPRAEQRRWLGWLMMSVYFYSALNKFDAQFLSTTGLRFVEEGARLLGMRLTVDQLVRLGWLAWLFPVGELAAALLLTSVRTRRAGLALAIGIHVMLLLLLGPWGLQHRWGVLIWNVVFIVQGVWIFAPRPTEASRCQTSERPDVDASVARCLRGTRNAFAAWGKPGRGIVKLVVGLALVMPCFEPLGWWDPWLSWGLYSARAPSAELWVGPDVVDQLPATVRPFCVWSPQDPLWVRVATDRWSLEAMQVPLYPHDRFQLGVALSLINELPTDERWVRLDFTGRPARRTGDVSVERVVGRQAMEESADRFWFNAKPRGRFNTTTKARR